MKYVVKLTCNFVSHQRRILVRNTRLLPVHPHRAGGITLVHTARRKRKIWGRKVEHNGRTNISWLCCGLQHNGRTNISWLCCGQQHNGRNNIRWLRCGLQHNCRTNISWLCCGLQNNGHTNISWLCSTTRPHQY